jgi:[acyl-carrier-protein] S-malonyltransferase
MNLAVVFPGQGSQRVGMGQDWLIHESAGSVFAAADQALGFPLGHLCFAGPEEELKLTANTQPAILTASIAAYRVLEQELNARGVALTPAYFAGHSLGEYTALVAAGALGLVDAVATVHERGRLMQEAVPPGEGAMAAVFGLDVETLDAISRQVALELNSVLEIANFNSPEQIVVSGSAVAVALASERYTAAGAKRVVELAVSAPFHCTLMVPAADGLKPRLTALEFAVPRIPVVANLTVQPYPADTMEYAKILHAQIFNPVRWTETVQFFAMNHVTHLLEVGPGKVLRGLAMKTARELKTMNLESEADLGRVADWAAGALEA